MIEPNAQPSRHHASQWKYGAQWLIAALIGFALLGMVANDDGQLAAAIAEQRARVALDANATDLNDLANLLVVRGDLDEAEAAYRQALELAPESIEIPYNLALLLQHREKNTEALKLFRRVVKKAPEAAWAHLQIGMISSDIGKRKQAIEAFGKAFALEPRLASPRINPHLQDRPEVLEAMLRGSKKTKATQTAPLSFSDPDRIARLLVGESAAARAAQRSIERRGLVEGESSVIAASEAADSGPDSNRHVGIESLPESAQTESSRPPQAAVAPERVTPMNSSSTEEPRRDKAASASAAPAPSRRVVGVDDLREVRGAAATSATSGRSSRSSVGTGSQGRSRQPTPVSVAPQPRTPVSGGTTSRFRPGARSSARLELRLNAPTPGQLDSSEEPAPSRWAHNATASAPGAR